LVLPPPTVSATAAGVAAWSRSATLPLPERAPMDTAPIPDPKTRLLVPRVRLPPELLPGRLMVALASAYWPLIIR